MDTNLCGKCLAQIQEIASDRIFIKQDKTKEGIIEIRPGVNDISLGERRYAQVRIYIGDSDNYIKGMALYSNDIPEGYDIVLYTRIKENGKFVGCGTRKRPKGQPVFEIIETEAQMVAWADWTGSIAKGKIEL